jgi:hypothetical protein
MMIAINIYAMICLLVMNPTLIFFEQGSFIDFLMKLLLIAGGGVSLKQSMALIGNLISNGAGSNELRDTAIAGGLGGMIGKIPGAGLLGALGSTMKQEIVGGAAQKILPSWLQRSYGNGTSKGGDGNSKGGDGKDSDSKNSKSPVGGGKDTAKQAIANDGKDNNSNTNNGNGGNKNGNKKDGDNTNNNKPNGGGQGSNLVNDAINNGGKSTGGYDDLYDD